MKIEIIKEIKELHFSNKITSDEALKLMFEISDINKKFLDSLINKYVNEKKKILEILKTRKNDDHYGLSLANLILFEWDLKDLKLRSGF